MSENSAEKYAEELRQLKEKARKIETMQAYCKHVWGDPKYVPERVEKMRYEQRKQGSDVYWEAIPTGAYELKDKWSRMCTICGKIQYTTERYTSYQEVKGGPKFR